MLCLPSPGLSYGLGLYRVCLALRLWKELALLHHVDEGTLTPAPPKGETHGTASHGDHKQRFFRLELDHVKFNSKGEVSINKIYTTSPFFLVTLFLQRTRSV